MAGCLRQILSLVVLLTCGLTSLEAQISWHDRPTWLVSQKPRSEKELARREALNFYVLGLLCEREDRLLEAVQAYEKAIQLDPEAAPVFKALIPFYLALERFPQALKATQRALDLNPDDYEAWFMYSRQLKNLGKLKEARETLARGLAVPGLKEHPEAAQPMYFLLGTLHENAKDYLPAAEAFLQAARILEHPEKILDIIPVAPEVIAVRAAEIYERAGRMYILARKFDQAMAAYRLAQGRNPDAAGRLNFNLAHILQEQGDLPQALNYLDAYLRLQPQGLDAYDLKIKLLHKLAREKEILPWLEKASQGDPFNMGLKLLLAQNYARSGLAPQAEKLYQEAAAKAPTVEVYRGLFRLYNQEPRWGMVKALDLLDKTLDQAKNDQAGPPQDPVQVQGMIAALGDDQKLAGGVVQAAHQRLAAGGSLKFPTVHFLAILAERLRQLEAAEKFYRQCLEQQAPKSEALLYSGLLAVLWKAQKIDDIVQVCRTGLQRARFTHPVLFHNDMARALARLGKMDQALAEADKAINLAADPDRFRLRHLRVRILTMADKFDHAEAECLALLKEFRQPGEVLETHYLLSNVYSAAKNFPKAEENLSLVLRLDPNNATANNDLGYIWADQGKNLKQAEELIRKALELDRQQRKNHPSLEADQDNPAYVDSLGWVLFRLGQLEASRHQLEKAVALPEGDDPTIWEHLGDVYYRLRQSDQARNAWQHALHLYERQKHRKINAKYKDLQRKFKLLDSARQP